MQVLHPQYMGYITPKNEPKNEGNVGSHGYYYSVIQPRPILLEVIPNDS